ncbi:unnamed protein product, partial [Hapterophycus canaliculatus]
ELLKLGALLIEFMHKELLDHRKELIKFAWNNIKVEDSGKHWAYVNVCRFICAYDTPPKIILQVKVNPGFSWSCFRAKLQETQIYLQTTYILHVDVRHQRLRHIFPVAASSLLFSVLVLKVYVQLLRCIQPEVKELVHAALDILVPALPFRLTTTVSTSSEIW